MRSSRWAILAAPLWGTLGVLIAIGVWWLASSTVVSSGGGRIPSPWVVTENAGRLLTSSAFWQALGVTALRGGVGLLIATAVSIVLSLLLARSRVVNAALEPLVSLLYPVPRIALFPIVALVLGIGFASQAAIVAVECMFPITVALYTGLRGIERNMVWLARNASLGPVRTGLLLLRLALPSLFTGIRIAAPLMITLTVAAQMFAGSSDGLGYLILSSAARIQTAQVFAIAALIGIAGYLLDWLIVGVERLTLRHETRASL